jgi:hypothetical protein
LLLQALDLAEQSVLIAGLTADLIPQSAILDLQLRQCFLGVAFTFRAMPSFAVQLTAAFIAVEQISKQLLTATTRPGDR